MLSWKHLYLSNYSPPPISRMIFNLLFSYQIVKVIEELNKKVANLTAEKKLVEDLLKNSLLQNELTRKKQISHSHHPSQT